MALHTMGTWKLWPRTHTCTQIRILKHTHTWLPPTVTNPGPVFFFDFRDPDLPMERADEYTWDVIETGVVHAVAFWFRLDLDDEASLSTAPENSTTCWKQAVQFRELSVSVFCCTMHVSTASAGKRIYLCALVSYVLGNDAPILSVPRS